MYGPLRNPWVWALEIGYFALWLVAVEEVRRLSRSPETYPSGAATVAPYVAMKYEGSRFNALKFSILMFKSR